MRIASSWWVRSASVAQAVLRGNYANRGGRPYACRPMLEELESRDLLNAPGAGYSLVFDDEFNGTALDTSKWSAASPSWTMPNSNSTASASQVSVANGVLTLKATRTSSSGNIQFSSG